MIMTERAQDELRRYLSALAERIATWCVTTFGEGSAFDREERAARLLEEAVELAQSEGVEIERARRIVQRTYDRPVGSPDKEMAGVFSTLLLYSHATKTDLVSMLLWEIERVESLPADYFQKKLADKFAAGTSSHGGPKR